MRFVLIAFALSVLALPATGRALTAGERLKDAVFANPRPARAPRLMHEERVSVHPVLGPEARTEVGLIQPVGKHAEAYFFSVHERLYRDPFGRKTPGNEKLIGIRTRLPF